jgi:AraC-like DNA-binding protein
MTYERPDIQLRYGVHAPGGQTISKPLDKPSGMNLRPRESKEFTDSNARRDLNPSAVSKQVVLPRCARHPHWVAGGSTGKAINGYVKEAVSQMVQNNCKLQTQPKKRRKELPGVPRSSSYRIFLRSTLPRAAHSARSTPKAGKGNGVDITGWLVSPGVRSMYAEDGAVVLDIKHGCCYSLNGVAAHVWVTIEGSPAGITFDGIVDVLESHLSLTREALERAARDCLADLQLAALVGKKVAGDEEPYATPILPSSPTGRFREFSQEGGRTAICEQHFVQRFETLESLVDQLFPQGLGRDIDWRAKKLKDSIDSASGEVHGGLRDVCRQLQLQLSLSIRQARRLFKDSTGISISEYHRKRRLALAAKLLQETDQPIKVVATEAGYRTSRGFEKGFYDMFHLTPLEFRRMWHRSHVTA